MKRYSAIIKSKRRNWKASTNVGNDPNWTRTVLSKDLTRRGFLSKPLWPVHNKLGELVGFETRQFDGKVYYGGKNATKRANQHRRRTGGHGWAGKFGLSVKRANGKIRRQKAA